MEPFICGFDSIGCIDFAKDFIVSGTASDQLFGTCEGLWEPDLVSRSFLVLDCHFCVVGFDWVAKSGWLRYWICC